MDQRDFQQNCGILTDRKISVRLELDKVIVLISIIFPVNCKLFAEIAL